MSTFSCSIIFDGGKSYSVINSTVNQFIMPAFMSIDNFAKFANRCVDEEYSEEQWRASAQKATRVYNLTKEKIHEATWYLSRMKRGESLSEDEACSLYEFWDFLRLTVADHQYEYDSLSKKVVDRWISELGMREQYPERWDYWDVLDCAMYESFQKLHSNRMYPDSKINIGENERSTPEQLNKLAGRYISAMALIAKIAGPVRRTIPEIVWHFFYGSHDKKIVNLKNRLNKSRAIDRSHLLLGIYKQLAVSNKGRQANGLYKCLLEENPERGLGLIVELTNMLAKNGLLSHANRLRKQYL